MLNACASKKVGNLKNYCVCLIIMTMATIITIITGIINKIVKTIVNLKIFEMRLTDKKENYKKIHGI
jgi:hypothetical protein